VISDVAWSSRSRSVAEQQVIYCSIGVMVPQQQSFCRQNCCVSVEQRVGFHEIWGLGRLWVREESLKFWKVELKLRVNKVLFLVWFPWRKCETGHNDELQNSSDIAVQTLCAWKQQFYAILLGRIATVATVDAAYCYNRSSVVCVSVCLSVGHVREPCKNGWTNRDAVGELGPSNHTLDGVEKMSPDPAPEWAMSAPLKSIGSLCCGS